MVDVRCSMFDGRWSMAVGRYQAEAGLEGRTH
jgi:hypothetical protein